MKKIYLLSCTLTALLLSTLLTAQHTPANGNMVIIQKTMNDDGTFSVKKKAIQKGQDIHTYLEAFGLDKAGELNSEVTLIMDTEDEKAVSETGEETVLMIRKGNNKTEIKWGSESDMPDEEITQNFMMGKTRMKVMEKEDPNKAFLGVYPASGENGVLISDIVSGAGAEAAGLQAGDLMTAINNESIRTNDDLNRALSNYAAGDVVIVSYLRDGQSLTAQAKLSAKKVTSYVYTERHHYYRPERNPCDVFIGVYVSSYGHNREGVGVTGIIPGTPGEAAGLLAGDQIIAIDGIPVSNHDELLTERDKHKAGDFFTISYLRNDEPFEVKAQFKACPDQQPEQVTEEEVLPELPPVELIDNSLQLEEFAAYPNPTYGQLNVRFRGEALPTTVMITDVNGKVVHQESLPNFDGSYNRQLDISSGTPGTLLLTVRQEGQVLTTPVVLLNRA